MQAARGWLRKIPDREQNEIADRYIKALDIRPANPNHLVRNLSGGNQQKVLLARWLLTQPKLLILDEPTRGIDIGAKAQIQKLVAELSDEGMSVVFISAEMEEVLRLAHRIGIMRDRRAAARIGIGIGQGPAGFRHGGGQRSCQQRNANASDHPPPPFVSQDGGSRGMTQPKARAHGRIAGKMLVKNTP
jgi:energy-coupling factor transporter ATP-binding protein EcfA2